MATTKFSLNVIRSREKLELLSELIKHGVTPEIALLRAGIKNLASTIIASELLNSSMKESTDTSAEDTSSKPAENSIEIIEELLRDLVDKIVATENDELCGGGDATTPKKPDFKILQEFKETSKKNALENLVHWLSSEAEYCSHALLMAAGNVLINDRGEMDANYMWAPPGHESLTGSKHPVVSATQRLKVALESLGLLFTCEPVRSFVQWEERYRKITEIVSASGNESMIPMAVCVTANDDERNGEVALISTKPFYEIIADQSSSHDLYLLKNGLAGYVEALQRLLDRMTGLHWNLNILSALNEASDMICDFQQIRGMVDNIESAKKITDIRVAKTFLKLFRSSYGNLSFADKKRIMHCFYGTYGTATWHEMDEEFGTNLTLSMNKLHNRNYKNGRQLAEEFAWFFMMAMRYTWWRILTKALREPDIIMPAIEVLRQLPAVGTLRGSGELLLLAGVKKLGEPQFVNDEESESNWVRLACALVSGKTFVSAKNGHHLFGLIQPLIDKTEGLATVFMPILSTKPRMALNLLLSILDDGLAWNVNWSGSIPTADRDEANVKTNEINAAGLIVAIMDTYSKFAEQQSTEAPMITKLCQTILPLLVVAWKDAGFGLAVDTVRWLEKRYETSPWTVQCWLFGNLRQAVADSPDTKSIGQPLPKCFFDVFDLSEIEYRMVDCENWDPNHKKILCALKGLFQLIDVSGEMVRNILNCSKFEYLKHQMKKGNKFTEQLIDGLAEVLAEYQTLDEWRKCYDLLATILDRLKTEAGVSWEEVLGIPQFVGGQVMAAPAAILCEASNRIHKKSSMAAPTFMRNFTAVFKEIVMERVFTLDDPLAKYVAWYWLVINYGKLIEVVYRPSSDMIDLYSAIVDEMMKEKIRNDAALVPKNFDKHTKMLISKKLGI